MRAGVLENLLEDPAHREHGRPGVDEAPARLDLAHFSAGTVRGVERRHLEAARRERDGRGEAAHPRADDHDPSFDRHGGPPNRHVDQDGNMCQFTLHYVMTN